MENIEAGGGDKQFFCMALCVYITISKCLLRIHRSIVNSLHTLTLAVGPAMLMGEVTPRLARELRDASHSN